MTQSAASTPPLNAALWLVNRLTQVEIIFKNQISKEEKKESLEMK